MFPPTEVALRLEEEPLQLEEGFLEWLGPSQHMAH